MNQDAIDIMAFDKAQAKAIRELRVSAVASLRKAVLRRHVRMAHGGGEMPSGGSCTCCKQEWSADDTERHTADCALLLATSALADSGPKWRHVKRGSIVTEIARGFAQVAIHPIEEMTAVVIYRHDDDGRYWVRNAVEFDDGRFAALMDDMRNGEK